MYPDLSYLLNDLFATETDNWFSMFKTYGFFLGAAIMIAAAFFQSELRRKENQGIIPKIPTQFAMKKTFDYTNYLFLLSIGFLIGYKVVYLFKAGIFIGSPNFRQELLSTQGDLLSGVLMALFVTLIYHFFQTKKEKKKVQSTKDLYPSEIIHDIIIIAAVSGMTGAKVFALLEELPALIAQPIDTLLNSGISFYGGLIFGFISVCYYLKKRNVPVLPALDAVAPALILSYGIGRLGCHLSGDGDWGIIASAQPNWWFLPDWFWSYTFPHNVLNRGFIIDGCTGKYCQELSAAVYPTSLYEFMMAALIFALLWFIRKSLKTPGMLFSLYLMFNGLERFSIEFIRVNDRYALPGLSLSQAQMIAICLFLIGLLGMAYLYWSAAKNKSTLIASYN